ncbi:homoserine kinase [Desulfohalovibrio reitneri]|uniref:homoserine kinase n=1 Tax=Desulfohalovibrio reitneri TaxID=1307759 RepID=UPI0004A73E25|nr:homoserine kinase [Desulfohalovibrio reitneri]
MPAAEHAIPDETCVILIGIAGAGKSTLAPLLAHKLGWEHMDTDRLLEATHGRPLQDIMDSCGRETFLHLEEEVVANLGVKRLVVSTGGSVVYSRAAMDRLRLLGTVVFLDISLETFLKRVGPAEGRAFVCPDGYCLEDVYEERRPLYLAAADVTVRTDTETPETCANQILRAVTRHLEESQA